MDLYQENILDHYHHPRHSGKLATPTHKRCANNPTCGDNICIDLIIDENDIITDIAFDGNGCAISQAATSIITEQVIGKPITDVLALTKDDVIDLLGIEIGIGRIRCALLGIETIQKAIQYNKITEN
jgi:nitrogen fixation protein NifU and related proteins